MNTYLMGYDSLDKDYADHETELAAQEAAQIGGYPGDYTDDFGLDSPESRAVREGGGGEAEGFEDSERLLMEHTSHGDYRPAHTILRDQSAINEESNLGRSDGEADHELSSELEN